MFKHLVTIVIIQICIIGLSNDLRAEERQESSPMISPEMMQSIGSWVDSAHEMVSQQVLGTADRFDGFFGDERIDEEAQNTQLSLGVSTIFSEDLSPAFTFPLGLKLSLPRLENRIQLAIDTLLAERSSKDDALPGAAQEDIEVKVRYKVLEEISKWISVDGGVKMNPDTIGVNTLEPFGSLRFRITSDSDPWASRFTQVVDWYEQAGWSGVSQVDLERYVGEKTFLRMSSTSEYAEEFEGIEFSQALFIRYQFSRNRAIGLELVADGHTFPTLRAEQFEIRSTYRRRLYKTWAFFSIQPIARFAREDNFEFTPLLRVDFELYFGRVEP